MKNIAIKNVFFAFIVSLTTLLVLSFVFIHKLNLKTQKLVAYYQYKNRYEILAENVFQTIGSMSDMAYYYVITGDKTYEQQYQILQNLRDKTNPQKGSKSFKEKVAELDLMPLEKERFAGVEKLWYKVATSEVKAIAAMQGIFDDGYGNLVIKQNPDTTFAKNLLFAGEYLKNKERLFSQVVELKYILENRVEEQIKTTNEDVSFFGDGLFYSKILMVILLLFAVFAFYRLIIIPAMQLQSYLLQISEGNFNIKIENYTDNELGDLFKASQIIVENLKEKEEFVRKIGEDDLNVSYVLLSDKDLMGKSLLQMKKNIIAKTEKEKQHKEIESLRNWMAEGRAAFVEIMQKNGDNWEQLNQGIIIHLVQYLKANQGGIFLINDDNENNIFIELVACFAYDRVRREKKRYELDEGLIGRAIFEKETIYLKEIPENYISITSGLGNANPRGLLIVPMKLNEIVLGVIEIASFKEFAPFQIEFIEQLAETIASTISTSRINARNTSLLKVFQEQAEMMAAQEEEMRQNIEELQQTQEVLDRKEREQNDEIERLNAENELKIQQLKEKEADFLSTIEELRTVQETLSAKEFEQKTEIDKLNRLTEQMQSQKEVIEKYMETYRSKVKTLTQELELKNQEIEKLKQVNL